MSDGFVHLKAVVTADYAGACHRAARARTRWANPSWIPAAHRNGLWAVSCICRTTTKLNATIAMM